RCVGKARKPTWCGCCARLFMGVVALVVVVVSEFIVSLQIMRCEIDGLGLGMAAQVNRGGTGSGSGLVAEDEANRGGTRGGWSQGVADGGAQGFSTVEVEQF